MATDADQPQIFQIISGTLNEAVCQEMLNEAQSLVKSQIDASDSLASKLTAILGQAIGLATASLGAAALVFPTGGTGKPWMPVWAALGFSGAGIAWIVTAFMAVSGLAPRRYQAGFSPAEFWKPEIVTQTSTARAFASIAFQLQPMIDENAKANRKLANQLEKTRFALICSPVIGGMTASIAAFFL